MCVPVALVMQHEMRVCPMVLSYVAVWLYDISPCYKRQYFRGKNYWTCVLFRRVRFRNLHRRPLIRANYFSRLSSYLQRNSGTRARQSWSHPYLFAIHDNFYVCSYYIERFISTTEWERAVMLHYASINVVRSTTRRPALKITAERAAWLVAMQQSTEYPI